MLLSAFFYIFSIVALIGILAMLLGLQIQTRELRLLTFRYNYRIQLPQFVTFAAAVVALLGCSMDICAMTLRIHESAVLLEWSHAQIAGHAFITIFATLLPLIVFVIAEWGLSRMRPSTAFVSWGVRFAITAVLAISEPLGFFIAPPMFTAFVLVGLYLRNNPFGIPHGKVLWIAAHMERRATTTFEKMNYVDADEESMLPDTSFAGCRMEEKALPTIDVTDFGIRPDTNADSTEALQQLIDQVGNNGGGRIFFPAGRYLFNTKGDHFIAINHSNITLEGAVDADGRPLATLVNCGKTSRGHKNPWISPFFITTGESLQPSNEFWGLQFRKRQATVLRSNSLSDPGSDGSILSPTLTAHITKSAQRGTTTLKVDNAANIGKYILIGLYNTTADGNLIRDILSTSALRPEWTVANRAGAEEAPSYQWLVEVKRIVDGETIELVRPLLRDITMEYAPVICNAELLENIVIRHLCIDSTWDGQFRHHGFPLYYNITRTQEMDYGWNAICMKRCAHSLVEDVVIRNFTNPLYVLDSRSVTVRRADIGGYDGHQGLKAYMHTCDCLFEDITFRAHYADMMGGEGNAYANVFRRVSYLNPVFNPVDYDFHGFASEPMSPPSDNMFTRITGFRLFKAAGSLSHLPSCARRNVWWNVATEGERHGEHLFFAMTYREKKGLMRWIYAIGYATAMVQKTRNLSPRSFVTNVREKLANIDAVGYKRPRHRVLFFPDNHVFGISTTGLTLIGLVFSLATHAQCLLWDVSSIDSVAITQSADVYCTQPPVAVTDKEQTRSGNRHNFEALSIYFWPDPENPDGPYIVRDGQPNPEYKAYDLPRLENLVRRTGALSRAFYVTGDENYYKAFCEQIDAWFLKRATRMVPDFEYNQFIPGRNDGKGCSAGLIDAYNFINVIEAVRLVETQKPLGRSRTKKLKKWFRSFADWMQTSELGQQEARATNNHGAAYDITLFVISQYIGDDEVCAEIVENFAARRINPQIMEDGSQPEELKRTKAFNYSVYNLQHLVDFCIIQRNLGNDYINADGKRIKKAIDFLDQYVGHRDRFPYQEIGDWEAQERNVRALKAKVK